jgi:hypothetical protein
MSVDILIALRDKDENRSFQPTLWLTSAVEVAGATRREMGIGGGGSRVRLPNVDTDSLLVSTSGNLIRLPPLPHFSSLH